MTVSIQPLYDIINNKVALPATKPVELMQLSEAAKMLDSIVYRVANLAALPPAAENKGRLIWVDDIQNYRYSNGTTWSIEYNSTQVINNDIWTWGNNTSGRLGDNTIADKSSPVSVVGGFTDWSQVSAGCQHTAAVRTNGTIWTWGNNASGRLGDNTIADKSSPVSVVGGFTDWCQVGAGCAHTAAVRTNGTIWSWGINTSGRLGNNAIVTRSSPVSVVGGFTDWCQVSAGDYHTAAVRTNGTIWTWGYNNSGRLGDNTIADKSSPVSVVGGFTDWCQVSAGYSHTAAVRTNGTIWSWGVNAAGKLGDGTVAASSSPVSVVGGFTDWCQVSASSGHTVAVRTNGTIWSWGFNGSGRLGNNAVAASSSPVSVVGGFTDWCQVSASSGHTVAVRTNGTIWSWGCGSSGQLGDNTIADKSSPVSVVGGFTDWSQVSASGLIAIAIRTYSAKGF
jgi:alpha-tubulin suppressor-like RCC1 family protein